MDQESLLSVSVNSSYQTISTDNIGNVQSKKEWNEALDEYDPPKSAVVWIVWLLGQLVVSVLLLMLSGFHFGLVRYHQCDSYNVSNFTNTNSSNSTGRPTCGFTATVLALAIIACIVSVFDAAMSLHYLTHKVLDKPEDNNQCKNGAERLSCFSSSKKFPSNTLRVLYCWILVHVILIFVAANTYKWSWETDELSVLTNTAIFFLTTTVYLLLIVTMVLWHGCCYTLGSCCQIWREETDDNAQNVNLLVPVVRLSELFSNLWKKIAAPLMTAGLIISNTLCMAVTLIVFFCSKPNPHKRDIGLAFVLVYVIVTSTFWWSMLACWYLYFDPSKCSKTKSIAIAIIFAVIIIITILLGVIIPLLIGFLAA